MENKMMMKKLSKNSQKNYLVIASHYKVFYLEELEQDEELEQEHDELEELLELHDDDKDEEQEEDS